MLDKFVSKYGLWGASYVLILFIRYHKLKHKQNGYRGGDYYEC